MRQVMLISLEMLLTVCVAPLVRTICHRISLDILCASSGICSLTAKPDFVAATLGVNRAAEVVSARPPLELRLAQLDRLVDLDAQK